MPVTIIDGSGEKPKKAPRTLPPERHELPPRVMMWGYGAKLPPKPEYREPGKFFCDRCGVECLHNWHSTMCWCLREPGGTIREMTPEEAGKISERFKSSG